MYDELVNLLRRCGKQKCKDCEYEHVLGCVTKLNEEAADAIEELKKKLYFQDITTAQILEMYMPFFIPKWIPVAERLPETIHEYVLCCGEKGGQFVGWIGEGRIVSGKVRAFQNGGKGRYITHWMPLPEPPKEE